MAAAKETVTEAKEPKKVELFIPKGYANEDPNFFISVNGVNYLLPRGKKSLVPVAVAQEYERSVRAQQMLDDHKDEMLEANSK